MPSPMQLLLVGLTYRTAPVQVRERLALAMAEQIELMARLRQPAGHLRGCLAECAVISTCNRFEVYGVAHDGQEAAGCICTALSEARGVPLPDLTPYLFHYGGEAVSRHLMAVAAGLDSMILGEPQILGQVSAACQAALSCHAAGPVLAALFRRALQCGKRARAETAISEHAVSVSHVAVELAKRVFGSLGDRTILLVGAGEMAELAARNLSDNGAGRILVINRSRERGELLARRFDGTAYGWDDLSRVLELADIVISSAAAPHTVIHTGQVQAAMARRSGRPLFLIDIAVPRNIEPAVGKLPGCYLSDIDDLQTVAQGNLAQRQREVPRVEAIVEACNKDFLSWFCSREVVSTIRDIRAAAEELREREVARALRRLGPLTEHQEEVIRVLAQNIVGKFLHAPTVRLKELACEGRGGQAADLVRDLFLPVHMDRLPMPRRHNT